MLIINTYKTKICLLLLFSCGVKVGEEGMQLCAYKKKKEKKDGSFC